MSPRAERSPAAARFDAALQSFRKAIEGPQGAVERQFRIGGFRVRLRFAGPALALRLTPALEHLADTAGGEPDLTVCLWDTASTGVSLPEVGPLAADSAAAKDPAHLVHWAPWAVLSLLDRERNLGIFWIRDAEALPYWECGAPLMTILHWWLDDRGCQVCHAAAVGTKAGGVLLAGKGGSGKSTTAQSCLGSPLLYAADDYCAVRLAPEPAVFSLYSSGKVNAEDVGRYPHLVPLEPALSNRDRLPEEKALYYLAKHVPDALVEGFPLRAIVIPRVTGKDRPHRAMRISPAASLLALAPSTLFQLPGAGGSDFGRLGALVRQVPCYALELGTDLRAIPAAILGILDEAGKERADA